MSEFIEVLSPKALADLAKLNSELTTTIKNVASINSSPLKLSLPSQVDVMNKKLIDDYKKMELTIQSLQSKIQKLIEKQNSDTASKKKQVQAILDQAKSYQALEKQKNKAIADIEKELTQLQKSENAYERVKAKINAMLPVYNNYKTKTELGIRLSAREEAQLAILEKRLVKYREVLNSVNKSYGNYSLEVGNYAKGNSNLAMSISQISREIPNFGQSLQIGIMSLTNNIGAVIDGVKQVQAQNEILKKQGLETKSAFSQILGAFFSWQTALFIGIGVINAYSKEIGDFFEQLFKGEQQLTLTTEALIRFKNAQTSATASTKNEIQRYKEYLEIASGVTKDKEKQKIAIEKLRSEYPTFLKALSDEQIMKLKGSELDKKIRATIGKGELYKEKQKEVEAVNLNIELIDAEIKAKNEYNKKLEKEREIVAKNIYYGKEGSQIVLAQGKLAQKRIEKLQQEEELRKKIADNEVITGASVVKLTAEKLRLEKLYNSSLVEQDDLKKEAILLETYNIDKTKEKREKIKLNFAEVESEYALKLAILERQKVERSDRMNNEDLSFDIRLQARKEFSEKSIEILNLELDKEKALYKEKYRDDLEKNNLAYRNKDLTAKEWGDNLVAINKRYNNEISLVDMQYSLKWNSLLNDDAEFYRNIQDKKREYSEQTNKLILANEKEKFDKISKDEKNTLTIRQKAFEQYLEFSKKELELQKIKELANATSNEEIILINQRYALAIEKLNELDSPLKKAQESTDKFIKSLSNAYIDKALNEIGLSSAKMFLDFDINGQSTFDKLIECADTMREKFAITFQAVGDVAQEVFGKIAEMSNQNFQTQYENLAKQKEVALLFAGESANGRAEIEKQYDDKVRQIRRREARAKKAQAIFDIGINTAQAIMATLGKTGFAGLPTALIVGSIGAIQAGIVASQKIPEFWTGVENSNYEGWATKDERGAELHFDKKGNIKDFGQNKGAKYTYVEKGDTIWDAKKTMDALMFDNSLNSMLTNNAILPPKLEFNNNNKGVENEIRKLNSTVANKQGVIVNINKNGIKTLISDGHSIKEIENKRYMGVGSSV